MTHAEAVSLCTGLSMAMAKFTTAEEFAHISTIVGECVCYVSYVLRRKLGYIGMCYSSILRKQVP